MNQVPVAITNALAYFDKNDILLPFDLVDDLGALGAVKTINYYTRVLKKLMRDLYAGKITEEQYVDGHAGYLERQFRRAFNQGMRANGLDPRRDMTAEWEALYQSYVIEEFQYIDRIGSEIFIASIDGEPIDSFLRRADLWANRFTEVVNNAMAQTGLSLLYEWELGETEEHCTDCFVNNGQIMTGQEWLDLVMPQSHELECNGYRCDCKLKNVKKSESFKGGSGSGNFGHSGLAGVWGGSGGGGGSGASMEFASGIGDNILSPERLSADGSIDELGSKDIEKRIREICEENGFPYENVYFHKKISTIAGVYQPDKNIIILSPLSFGENLEGILTHEIAHANSANILKEYISQSRASGGNQDIFNSFSGTVNDCLDYENSSFTDYSKMFAERLENDRSPINKFYVLSEGYAESRRMKSLGNSYPSIWDELHDKLLEAAQ